MSGQGSFGAFRTHGLGVDGWTPLGSGRRKIEAEDIAFALASRPRMGWQTIARIRGVNEVDLRRACERTGAIPPPSAEAATQPTPSPGEPVPTRRELQTLIALNAGDMTYEQIAARIGVEDVYARKLLSRLRIKGMICSPAPPERGYRLTNVGREALKRALHG